MESNEKVSIHKAVVMPTIVMLILGAVLFIPAGSLKFWQAWILWGEFFIMMFFTTVYLFIKNQDLLKRRVEFKEKEKMTKVQIILKFYILGYLIPGFDYRFHWSSVPISIVIISNIIVSVGLIIIVLVFKENSYTSTVIKIENGQDVISTGPYSVIRHPMYLGMLLITLFSPLALGSFWAIIPFFFSIPYTILRIKNEEELLLKELPGYKNYCLKTRYRLVPLIW